MQLDLWTLVSCQAQAYTWFRHMCIASTCSSAGQQLSTTQNGISQNSGMLKRATTSSTSSIDHTADPGCKTGTAIAAQPWPQQKAIVSTLPLHCCPVASEQVYKPYILNHTCLQEATASSLSSSACQGQQLWHVGPLVVLYELQPKG